MLQAKSQKTTAWILLGAGTAMFVGGSLGLLASGTNDIVRNITTGDTHYRSEKYACIMLIGAAADIVSIPFFISSAKNRKKGIEFSLNYPEIPSSRYMTCHKASITMISFKFNLSK